MKCFETIKVQDGEAFYLEYHNRRLNRTREAVFKAKEPLFLQKILKNLPSQGVFRCKVIYSKEIEKVEFFPYFPRKVESFKLLSSTISYPYKFLDRTSLEQLFNQRGEADEVLIIKNSLVTDTFIANVAFFYKKEWITPKKPLLEGTTRERLLEKGVLKEADIEVKDLKKFEKMAIMNAMIGFKELKKFTFKGVEDVI